MRHPRNRFYPVTQHEVEMRDPWKWVDDYGAIIIFMVTLIGAALVIKCLF